MTATRLHLVLAGLFGVCGVALLAAGAHLAGSNASTAGLMLVLHASAVIALTAARRSGLVGNASARVGVSLILVGVALFSADLAVRAFDAGRLFAFAAPIGGSLTIAGWLVVSLAAAIKRD